MFCTRSLPVSLGTVALQEAERQKCLSIRPVLFHAGFMGLKADRPTVLLRSKHQVPIPCKITRTGSRELFKTDLLQLMRGKLFQKRSQEVRLPVPVGPGSSTHRLVDLRARRCSLILMFTVSSTATELGLCTKISCAPGNRQKRPRYPQVESEEVLAETTWTSLLCAQDP